MQTLQALASLVAVAVTLVGPGDGHGWTDGHGWGDGHEWVRETALPAPWDSH